MLSNYPVVKKKFNLLVCNCLLLIIFFVLLWAEPEAEKFVENIPQIVNEGLS